MNLDFNRDQLLELMKSFYIASGIRIVLFDDEYQELLSYPESPCSFCKLMKAYPQTAALCKQSDIHSFQQVNLGKNLILYRCHAGLIEATIPLQDNHVVIGYLMFGQISDYVERNDLKNHLDSYIRKYQLPEITNYIDDISFKTETQIQAAAKLMEACTFYALYCETVTLRQNNFTTNLRHFLSTHLSESLTADAIVKELGISRSKLYLSCEKYLGIGIAEYIRNLRIEKAKNLLINTDQSLDEISSEIGIGDYNYFCKFFKKMTGVTPAKYRKSITKL